MRALSDIRLLNEAEVPPQTSEVTALTTEPSVASRPGAGLTGISFGLLSLKVEASIADSGKAVSAGTSCSLTKTAESLEATFDGPGATADPSVCELPPCDLRDGS